LNAAAIQWSVWDSPARRSRIPDGGGQFSTAITVSILIAFPGFANEPPEQARVGQNHEQGCASRDPNGGVHETSSAR
jgi:hypothetical protein